MYRREVNAGGRFAVMVDAKASEQSACSAFYVPRSGAEASWRTGIGLRCAISPRAPVCVGVTFRRLQHPENELLGLLGAPRFDPPLQRS